MNDILAIALVLVTALVLRAVVSAAMKRLSAEPVEEDQRSRGLGDVLARMRDRRR